MIATIAPYLVGSALTLIALAITGFLLKDSPGMCFRCDERNAKDSQ